MIQSRSSEAVRTGQTTIGRLRDRVRVEVKADAPDTGGQPEREWVPLCTVWAAVEPVGDQETWQARGVQGDATDAVTIRHRKDVAGAGRKARVVVLTGGNKVLNVEGVLSPVGAGREWLILLCRSEGRTP